MNGQMAIEANSEDNEETGINPADKLAFIFLWYVRWREFAADTTHPDRLTALFSDMKSVERDDKITTFHALSLTTAQRIGAV